MPKTDEQYLVEAMNYWYELATSEERMRDIDIAALGPLHDTRTYAVRAESYRNAARSIRLLLETGEDHCSCHLMTATERARARGDL